MLQNKTLLIKTKSKKILRIVREHYLRDDIDTGLQSGKLEDHPSLKNELIKQEHYLLPDTNVILQQIDVLEHECVRNVIITDTVLNEVKRRSSPIYKKLRSMIELPDKKFFVFVNTFCKDTWQKRNAGETSNDYNDRLIRISTQYYQEKLLKSRGQACVLITNDKENKRRAETEGLIVFTAEEYFTKIVGYPELSDKLAMNDENVEVDKKTQYKSHKMLSVLSQGIKSKKYFQGKLNISQNNYLEGKIMLETKEILIQGRENLNRGVHGDLVAVELLSEDQWSCPSDVILDVTVQPGADIGNQDGPPAKKKKNAVPTGRVVGIIKRNWRPYCGMLEKPSATRHQLFTPKDSKIPRIKIETKQADKLKNQKIIVKIDSWPANSKYPHGHFVRALGMEGDKDTEREVILLEHDIAHEPFSEAVLNCLPPTDWSIPEKELKKRLDLRHLPVCSVDPPGCTDIDDCLHCVDEGEFLNVGVHIADVSYFIRPNTPIDIEASQRGTTVYLIDKRIDMVPGLLSSNLCSLRDDGDRLAFSCLWKMNKNGEILETKFAKSVIRSKKSMTYAEAQLRINDTALTDDVTEGLRGLNKIAKILKAKRIQAGALSLSSPELRFHVDSETHDPIDVKKKEVQETNSLVEEFMLLANCSVAAHIHREFPEFAVLRRHPEPPNSNFDVLINSAKARGLTLSCETSRDLAVSLDALEDNAEAPYIANLLRILATRCMLQAVYFCSGLETDFRHYGLAAPIYTHFTSPIRRYSDVMVHRLLAASIDADETFDELLNKQDIHRVCQNLNLRHRMAQYAGRASAGLYTQMFFKGRVVTKEAHVIFARKNAVQVLIMEYGFEGTVFLDRSGEGDKLGEGQIKYDEEACSVEVKGVVLKVFDKVVVRISHDASNVQRQRVNLHLVEPKIEGISVQV